MKSVIEFYAKQSIEAKVGNFKFAETQANRAIDLKAGIFEFGVFHRTLTDSNRNTTQKRVASGMLERRL